MLAPTINTTIPFPAISPFILRRKNLISAAVTPSSSSSSSSFSHGNQQQQEQQVVYQPFKRPRSPLAPLDVSRRLEILSNRLGLWFEYAPIISSLLHDGFTPTSIEESTGISGVEQNRLIVASQVRQSLIGSPYIDPQTLTFFDSSGAELLYQIRILNTTMRASAVRYIVANRLDHKEAQELARSIKDFPRRREEIGWECFRGALPGDCMAFARFRKSLEILKPSKEALEFSLDAAESESARARIREELLKLDRPEDEMEENGDSVSVSVKVPVVRMEFGEVAEAKVVVIFPVCLGEEEIESAPWECTREGEFGEIVAEKEWRRWVVLPGWPAVTGLVKGGAAVRFSDARILPWKVNRWYKEEGVLVVVDRERKVMEVDDGFYLVRVLGEYGRYCLKVDRGLVLREMGVEESLGMVVLVVRPPRDDGGDGLTDEDWE